MKTISRIQMLIGRFALALALALPGLFGALPVPGVRAQELTPADSETPSETPEATLTATPASPFFEVEEDPFDGPDLAPGWEWYVPHSGPAYSLTDVPGSLRISLPPLRDFDHWIDVDHAPQLRRGDLGAADWVIESRLEGVDARGAGYWAALEVGFDDYDQVWFGMVDDGKLKVARVGQATYFEMPQTLPITLRIEQHAGDYTFMYRHDADTGWTVIPTKAYAGTPAYAGLITRSFGANFAGLDFDWSYIRLERWSSLPGTPTATPTVTRTATRTPSATVPSRTPTFTLTPTVPTSTPTLLPSSTRTPTGTRTNTPVPPTATRTQTATWTSTQTVTRTRTATPPPATLTHTPTLIPTDTETPTDLPTPTEIPPLFGPYVTYPSGSQYPAYSVEVGDFNNDGLTDAALTVPYEILVYLQNPDGTLSADPARYSVDPAPYSLAAGDFNHDGRTDLVVVNPSLDSIGVFLQGPDGSLMAPVSLAAGRQPVAVAAGDVNGDELDDIVAANFGATDFVNTISVYIQNADSTLNPMVSYAVPETGMDIAIGDVNGDGRNDVVKTGSAVDGAHVLVLLQEMDGTFGDSQTYSLPCDNCHALSLDVGDITGDGRADISMSYGGDSPPDAGIAVFAQADDGTLQPAFTRAAVEFPYALKVAPFGFLDELFLVTANGPTAGTFSLYAHYDGVLLSDYELFDFPQSVFLPQALTLGDLDHNGWPDVVAADDQGLVVSYDRGPVAIGIPTPPPPTPPFATGTATATTTPSITVTATPTNTETATPTETVTVTTTITSTPTLTVTVTASDTPTMTPSRTRTVTSTPTIPTVTFTRTFTPTMTSSRTRTPTPTRTTTGTTTDTATPTETNTATVTETETGTLTPTETETVTETETPAQTDTATLRPTRTRRPTLTPWPTRTATLTRTPTKTLTRTATRTPTKTRTLTPTWRPPWWW